MKKVTYILVIFCIQLTTFCGNELGNMNSTSESAPEVFTQKQAIIAYLDQQKKQPVEEIPALVAKKSRSNSMKNVEIYQALRNHDLKTIHILLKGSESKEPLDISDDKLFSILIRTCFAQPMGRLKETLQKRFQADTTLLEKCIHDNGEIYSLLDYAKRSKNPDAIDLVKKCL